MNVSIRHILVALDLTPAADRVLDCARAVAGAAGATAHLVHVLEEPFTTGGPYEFHLPDTPERRERRYTQVRAKLSGLAAQLQAASVHTTIEVRSGRATEEIEKAARDYGVDMIVMGTHARRGLQHLLIGSVAEEVIRGACCPVLTVRAHQDSVAASAA
jgi:nucleotide-binding universal stress UspA family protein